MVLGSRPSRCSASRKAASLLRHLLVARGVVAGVRPELPEHGGVEVADGGQVQLHGPAAAGVHAAHFQQQRGAEGFGVLPAERDAPAQVGEEVAQGRRRDEAGRRGHQGVVRGPAAQLVEGGVAPVQGRDQVPVRRDGDARGRFQPVQVGVPGRGVLHRHGLVGPEAGRHHRLPGLARGGVGGVVLQPVGRVVGGADGAHLHPGQQGAGAEGAGGQLGVAGLPDHRGGAFRRAAPGSRSSAAAPGGSNGRAGCPPGPAPSWPRPGRCGSPARGR